MLIEFWDFCRPNSIRTLPYVKAWHERYETNGLRVIGVHASGFPPSGRRRRRRGGGRPAPDPLPRRRRRRVRHLAGVRQSRLAGTLPVQPAGPSVRLPLRRGRLRRDRARDPGPARGRASPVLSPVRPEDAPDALLVPQSEDIPGPYSGPYEAGGVWAVLDGDGTATANGSAVTVDHPGCYELISHPRSTAGVLDLRDLGRRHLPRGLLHPRSGAVGGTDPRISVASLGAAGGLGPNRL